MRCYSYICYCNNYKYNNNNVAVAAAVTAGGKEVDENDADDEFDIDDVSSNGVVVAVRSVELELVVSVIAVEDSAVSTVEALLMLLVVSVLVSSSSSMMEKKLF